MPGRPPRPRLPTTTRWAPSARLIRRRAGLLKRYWGAVPRCARNTRSPQRSARRSTSLLTYVDTCELGIDVDTGAIPDYALFHDVIVPGLDDVLALAG